MGKLSVPGAIVLAGALVAAAVYLRPNWAASEDESGMVTVTSSDLAGTHVVICRPRMVAADKSCSTTLNGLKSIP